MKNTPSKKMNRHRRGTTVVEMMISTFLVAILGLMVIPSTIYFSQALKAQRFQQMRQKEAVWALRMIDSAMISASAITVANIADEEVTLLIPRNFYETVNGETVYTQRLRRVTLRFEDDDDDLNTIADNRLTMIDEETNLNGNVVSTEEHVLLTHVSPFLGTNGNPEPIFSLRASGVTGAQRDYVQLICRIGDRTNPERRADDPIAREDDRISGVGYQGFTFRSALTPNNTTF